MPLTKQELYCHNCDGYVQFDIDIDINGKYTIPCPKCGHEHYRFVEDGKITDKRWASSSANIKVSWATYSQISIDSTTSTSSSFFYFNADGTTYEMS